MITIITKSYFLANTVFYGFCTVISFLSFNLSKNWDVLIKTWSRSELVFLRNVYTLPPRYWSLRKKLLLLTIVFLLAALFEHLLSFISAIKSFVYKAKKCGVSTDVYFKAFITDQFSHLFDIIPYNVPIACFLEFLNISCTFYWNYLDLLIMLISISIAHRFQQINERIEFFRERVRISTMILKV